MRRWFIAVTLFSLLTAPLIVEAEETLHSDVSFQVKSAEIFYTDEGVFVKFKFFQPAKLNELVVPANILNFQVRGEGGTTLRTTYQGICRIYFCFERALKATVLVSRQSVTTQWQERISQVSREYETLKIIDVVPTIPKKK